MIELNSLRLKFLCGNPDREGLSADYLKTYELWKGVWTRTFRELDGVDFTPSDDFSRQHEILSLFHQAECIALVCHRYLDMNDPAAWDDSYFRHWPKDTREALKKGSRLVIGSQITVHEKYRGRLAGISVKELISHCSLRHLSQQNVDAITGVMRADKGMNHVFYACGAQPLLRDHSLHQVPVDLVGFFPKKFPIRIPETYSELVEELLKTSVPGLKSA